MNLKITLFLIVLSIFSATEALDKSFCRCKTKASKRVVNGRQPPIYPWLATISVLENDMPKDTNETLPYSVNKNGCMGTILNENTIITSASCIPLHPDSDALNHIRVGVGSNELETMKRNAVEVEKAILHPQYQFESGINLETKNDLAILKLKNPLNLDDVEPACLDLEPTIKYEKYLFFAGFGSTKALFIDFDDNQVLDYVPSKNLVEGVVTDFSHLSYMCKAGRDQWICTNGGSNLCIGDVGTAMHSLKDGKTYVVGVATIPENNFNSYLSKYSICGNGANAARLSSYREWITDVVGDNNYCH